MKAKLMASSKFEVLMAWLPDLSTRPWLDALSRYRRKAIGRFLFSQHRVIWETGRWSAPRIPQPCRLCPHCRIIRNVLYKTSLKQLCLDSGQCSCPGHTCVGSEAHYVNHCPITRIHWYLFTRTLRDSHGISAHTVQELLNPVETRSAFEWRQIGRTLSQTITRTLRDAGTPQHGIAQ